MNARATLFGAAVPLALVGIITAASAPAPAVKESPSAWRAVVVHADGNSDIVEYGVTLDDCEAVLIGYPNAAERICEPMPEQRPRLIVTEKRK